MAKINAPDAPDAPDSLDEITHRWGRRALATGRVAGSALRLAARRLRKAPGDDGVDAAIGTRLARELDQMKGLAMKVGQIISYFDGLLPPETHRALQALQRGAQPVAFDVMARVIEDAFGQPVDALFDDIDRAPVAAASIGQVHRARLPAALAVDGEREVAVKVQYPNVRVTLASDFSRIRGLSRLASLATAVDGVAIAREFEARVLEECDYEHEAACQAAFRAAFAADPVVGADVRIPYIVPARSCGTVLTSEWCDGLDFYAFVERASAARRSAVGLVLARFAYRSLYHLATVNADPHPGNYLFSPEPDGPVVFLDFGCVRQFEREFLDAERDLARVVIEDRRDKFRDAVIATGMAGKPKRFDFDHHWRVMCHMYAPYRVARFAFTPEYIREGVAFNGPSNPNARRIAIPPPWIWLQRLQWGLHAVLARLGADGPFADVLRDALDAPIAPLAIPPVA